MSLTSISIRVKHSASQLTKERIRKLQRGQVKEVLRELNIKIAPDEKNYLSNISRDEIIAFLILEAWRAMGIKNISLNDIKRHL